MLCICFECKIIIIYWHFNSCAGRKGNRLFYYCFQSLRTEKGIIVLWIKISTDIFRLSADWSMCQIVVAQFYHLPNLCSTKCIRKEAASAPVLKLSFPPQFTAADEPVTHDEYGQQFLLFLDSEQMILRPMWTAFFSSIDRLDIRFKPVRLRKMKIEGKQMKEKRKKKSAMC